MKVYTKTGDAGTTSLVGGERVPKTDPRVEAYGTVDELASHLALLSDEMRDNGNFEAEVAEIERIQRDLMNIEALLAVGAGGKNKVKPLGTEPIHSLEENIDRMEEWLAAAHNDKPAEILFVIPGGHIIVSQSHICRTVCRRAERTILGIPEHYSLSPEALAYINRLSDWLYVVGRKAAVVLLIKDTFWKP
jgi:cob(I)alamin adenosyltransferase